MKINGVTEGQASGVLRAVAEWMGTQGYGSEPGKPAPTGADAAYNGLGPELQMAFDWPGITTPAVVLEGGPFDWAVQCVPFVKARCPRVYVETYSGWALCIYPRV